MIDGVKIKVRNLPFQEWRKKVPVKFLQEVDAETGEVVATHSENVDRNPTYEYRGVFQSYHLTVKERYYNKGQKPEVSYLLFIRGSLHGNYFGGKNVRRFTISALQMEIRDLCTTLHLSPHICELENLEIGVNIVTPFLIEQFLSRNLLLQSTNPFKNYNPDRYGKVIGKLSIHAQYHVKCYSKSLQHNLDYPLMRFEVRCKKMQYLKKYCVKTLADLTDTNKLQRLTEVVLTAWDKVLVCDPGINPDQLQIANSCSELLRNGRNDQFWAQLRQMSRHKFNKQRQLFKRLTATHGTDYHALVKKLIAGELETLFVANHTISESAEQRILTIKINSKIAPPLPINSSEAIDVLKDSKPLKASEAPRPSQRIVPSNKPTVDQSDCNLGMTILEPVEMHIISEHPQVTSSKDPIKVMPNDYPLEQTRELDQTCTTLSLHIAYEWIQSRFLKTI